MKKSKIFVLVGISIIITFFLCNFNVKKVYEKKIVYSNINEIINVLDKKILNYNDNLSGEVKILDDFSECLSRRKRITESGINYSRLDVEIDKDTNTEKNKNRILNDYYNSTRQLEKYKEPKKIEAAVLKGTGYYDNYGINNYEDIYLEVVFIDEGEGYVIDYIYITYPESNEFNDLKENS